MSAFHRYIGFAIPAGFVLLMLWSIFTLFRKRAPHDWFWNLLGLLQAIIAIQVIVGAVLFVVGNRPPPQDLRFLHYFYGGLFPAIVLIAAHRVAARERWREVPWLVFGFASFVNFGLTSRALMTGLGVGV